MDRFFFVIFLKNPTMKNIFTAFLCLYCLALFSQSPLYDIIENVSLLPVTPISLKFTPSVEDCHS